MTALIDTNVIIDYILGREPFAPAARECVERLLAGNSKARLTASTITDIYYLTRRALKDKAAAKNVIAKLLNAFQIAFVDKSDCLGALEINAGDYEDALVIVCAKKVKAEYIITRNVKDFSVSAIPVVAPADFLSKTDCS